MSETEPTKKNKSGAGKFFLGAALGALAGAIASKFISFDKKDCEEEVEDLEESFSPDTIASSEPVAEKATEPVKKAEAKKPRTATKTTKTSKAKK